MDNCRTMCLRVYSDVHEAHLAASILMNHGIACTVAGDEIARSLSWYGLAVRKVQLLVHAANVRAATTVLEEFDARHHSRIVQQSELGVELNWICVTCDEHNPAAFDECWSCGAGMPENPEWRPAETPQNTALIGRLSEHAESEDSSLWFPPLALYSLYLAGAIFRHREASPGVLVLAALNGLIVAMFVLIVAVAVVNVH